MLCPGCEETIQVTQYRPSLHSAVCRHRAATGTINQRVGASAGSTSSAFFPSCPSGCSRFVVSLSSSSSSLLVLLVFRHHLLLLLLLHCPSASLLLGGCATWAFATAWSATRRPSWARFGAGARPATRGCSHLARGSSRAIVLIAACVGGAASLQLPQLSLEFLQLSGFDRRRGLHDATTPRTSTNALQHRHNSESHPHTPLVTS
jgi:hypothetical protein